MAFHSKSAKKATVLASVLGLAVYYLCTGWQEPSRIINSPPEETSAQQTGATPPSDAPPSESLEATIPPPIYHDDRDKTANPKYASLGTHAMPVGRPRTEAEIHDSIAYARRKMLEKFPLQADLIKALAALEETAVRRKGNDKSPNMILQSLPGMGKSTVFKIWESLRDKRIFRTEVLDDKTIDFPAEAIFRASRPVKPGDSPDADIFYDGLDLVFVIDELDKAKSLADLKIEHDEIIRRGKAAIEARIQGQMTAENPIAVEPVDLQKFDNPVTPYEERLRSLRRLWSAFDSGFAAPAPLFAKLAYIKKFQVLLDGISASQLQIKGYEAQVTALKAAAAGSVASKTALSEAEAKRAQYESIRDYNISQVYYLMRNMRLDYETLFTPQELEESYHTHAEQFVSNPEVAKKMIQNWIEREPKAGRGREYDMRGTLTVFAKNSSHLREMQEILRERKLPVSPSDANALIRALEHSKQPELRDEFWAYFTDREGVERRFNWNQFQHFLYVPTEKEWRTAIVMKIDEALTHLRHRVKSKIPNLDITVDPSVYEGLYDLTVDGFQGWDPWRDTFDSFTKTFFSELAFKLGESPEHSKLHIKLDRKTGEYVVSDKTPIMKSELAEAVVTGKPIMPFELSSTPFFSMDLGRYVEALNQPGVSEVMGKYRATGMTAAKQTVGTSLFAAVPNAVNSEFAETGLGYGAHGQWKRPNVNMNEYELKTALTDLASYVWLRESGHSFETDPKAAVDFIRSYRTLQYTLRDPQARAYAKEFLDRYLYKQGINFFLPFRFKFNRVKPLEQILPLPLVGTSFSAELEKDPELAHIFQAMYAYDAYILRRNRNMVTDLARQLRESGDVHADPETAFISEVDFRKVVNQSYSGGFGLANIGRIHLSPAGEPTLDGCINLLANVSTRGRFNRWVNRKFVSPERVNVFRWKEWFLKIFRSN